MRLLAFGLLLLAATAWAADPVTLRLLTEDYPPFNMLAANSQISGSATDIVRELMQRNGIRYSIELLPWLRAFNRAVLEPGTCVYSTTRTDPRESLFKWIGPVAENPWVLYARSDNPRVPNTLEDARRYRLGGYAGDAVAQYLIARNFDVDLANSDEQNVRKLQAGRIDYWATGKYIGAQLAAREKAGNIRPVLTFNTTFMYLACNLGLSDQLVGQLNDTLHKMQKDGTVAKINAHYLRD
ncbi:ABC transporter substrate-binding protein [Vogesella sp. LIG4]|uniref:substrate-binding periplasmic protein n=1 Tax=Vogesella sp. LIG4 TaxID=1192162 RepID=UPI00081FB7AE|nr:ABC transporter substrate-binding protein [Vogesella sp. LIG4]SCK11507.1 polar amino acid transport system substrate-binding protein [Vogesella sp. LIG4]